MLDEFEINYTALAVSVVVGAIIGSFLIFDVLNVGMDRTPMWARVVGMVGGLAVGYYIAAKQLD